VKKYVDFFIAIGHGRPRTIIPFTTVSRDNVYRFEKDSIITGLCL